MEQTICISHYIPSSHHHHHHHNKTSSTRRRNNAIVQAIRTPISTIDSNTISTSLSPTQHNASLLYGSHLQNDSLVSTKQLHAHIIKSGDDTNDLIRMYSDLGDIQSAAMLLLNGLEHTSLSWTDQSSCRLFEMFQELHRNGILSSVRALNSALRICGERNSLLFGSQIHAYLTKVGLDAENHLKCSLMDFYAGCASLESSEKLLEEATVMSSLLWNKVIMLNAENGLWSKAIGLFRKMQSSNVEADEVTIAKILNACGRMEGLMLGKEIHGHVVRSGLSSNLLVSNSLIAMYSKNSCVEHARRVFESLPNRNLVSWNSMISCFSLNGHLTDAMELFDGMVLSGVEPDLVTWNSLVSGYSLHGHDYEVFELIRRMQVEGEKPNSSTITSILRTVSESKFLELGRAVHGYVTRHALECNVYIGTSLVDMYVKCCSLANARRVFEATKHRNAITWNSLISGYAYEGSLDDALKLLKRMEGEGIQPNLTTWNSLISGYSMKGQSKQSLVLIRHLKEKGMKPNVVSWTALISGCCQNEQYEDSLYFFHELQKEGIKPNSATLATALRACASLASLSKGTELHCFATRKGLIGDIYVATALIDMYYKSGSLRNAQRVFESIRHKNLASWNAMIMGFASYGQSKEAGLLFDEMCRLGVKPDGITFIALLSACRHSGLISEGWKYFDDMRSKYGVSPRLEHYTSMVDLLGRGGYLDEAWDFIQGMPLEPDARLWGALLGACRTHRNLKLAETCAKHLFKLEPRNSANYLLITSLYASEKRWEDVENMRIAMNAAGVRSRAGWSWTQIGQTVHVFAVEGKQHPDIGEIYFELYQLVSEIRKVGYVPDTRCIVHNVGEAEKEKLLMSHTEKLAITYGLIRTGNGSAIRVIKNTRVCNDCHMVAKYISGVTGREIFLRDGVRFHHFKGGKCSCNDYW
ncbi:pentatricopeptide repeat-containing protein, mitochondrial [Iris pallida]|uniref:Pentatricopeptide repeat-containing protein, mitochondrial n=1 Tax=Iris pallida TaxID=29817 RepID=A0AAX6GL20_IRIPA|nr:pentatricopeptide repeat-containing protein, mitochondrial [Iris pallida]